MLSLFHVRRRRQDIKSAANLNLEVSYGIGTDETARQSVRETSLFPRKMKTKRCSKCGEVKPLTEFYSDPHSKGGKRSDCKICVCERQRRYTLKHREENRIRAYLWRQVNPERVKELNRQYREEHKEELRIANSLWNVEHAEEKKAYNQQYRKEHKEEIAACMALWQQENEEKVQEYRRRYYQENAIRLREYARLYRYEHPEQVHEYRRLRRARVAGAMGTHTIDEFYELCEYYGWHCLRCRMPHVIEPLTKDHIVPLTKGGDNTIDNIQPLCKRCNSKKYNHIIDYRHDPYWADWT